MLVCICCWGWFEVSVAGQLVGGKLVSSGFRLDRQSVGAVGLLGCFWGVLTLFR